MTKEITKAYILQQIEDKFKLREFEPSVFSFSETVVPVYNIEQHLVKPENKDVTMSVTATGAIHFFDVPDDEKWTLNAYTVIFVTGAYTIAGVLLGRPSILTDYVYLDLTAAINVSYTHVLPTPINMYADDRLGINVDGYTSTGNLLLRIDVVVEKIR